MNLDCLEEPQLNRRWYFGTKMSLSSWFPNFCTSSSIVNSFVS